MDLRGVRFCAVLQVLFVIISTATVAGYDPSKTFIRGPLRRQNHRKFYDEFTGITAIKDSSTEKCYIRLPVQNKHLTRQKVFQYQIISNQLLEVAGPKILKFCNGYPSFMITSEPFSEPSQKSNIKKRSTQHYFVGRRRGQTQSQYLNFGNSNEPGKAEAEFTAEGSRAVVTGSNGMGQAQSQSGTSDCGDCRTQDQTLHYFPPNASELGADIYAPGSIGGTYPEGEIRRPGGEGQVPLGPSGSVGPGGGRYSTTGTGRQPDVQGPSIGNGYNGALQSGQRPASTGRFPGVSGGFPSQTQPLGPGGIQQGSNGRGSFPSPGISGVPSAPGRPGFVSGGQPGISAGPGFTNGVSGIPQQPNGAGLGGGRFPALQQGGATQPSGGTGQFPTGDGAGQFPISTTGIQGAGGQTQGGTAQFPSTNIGTGQFPTSTTGVQGPGGQPLGGTGQFPSSSTGTGQFPVSTTGVQGPGGGTFGGTGQFPSTSIGTGQFPVSTTGVQGPGGQPLGGAEQFPSSSTGTGQFPVSTAGVQGPGGQTFGGTGQFPSTSTGSSRYPVQGPSALVTTQRGGLPSGQFPIQTGAGGQGQPEFQPSGGIAGRPQQTFGTGQLGETQRGQFSGRFAGNYVPDAGQAGRFSGTFAGQYEGGRYGGQPTSSFQNGVQYGSDQLTGTIPATVVPSPGSQFISTTPGGQLSTNGHYLSPNQLGSGAQTTGGYPSAVYAPSQAETQGAGTPGGTVQYGGGAAGPGYGVDLTSGYGPGQAPAGQTYGPGYGGGTGGRIPPGGYGTVTGYPESAGAVQFGPGGRVQYGPGAQNGRGQFGPGTGGTQYGGGGGQNGYGTGGTQFGPGPGGIQYGGGGVQNGRGAGGVALGPGTQTGPVQFGPSGGDTPQGGNGRYGPGSGGAQNGLGGGGTQFRPEIGTGSSVGGRGGNGRYVPSVQNGYGTGGMQQGPIQFGPGGGAAPIGGNGQYGGGGTGAVGPQQFPDQSIYGPGTLQQFGPGGEAMRQDQTYQGVSGEGGVGPAEDDSDSEAQSSVQQINNETQASASAQGKFAGGTAQSQVQGSYFGSGSFTASAGTSDGRRGAQTSISGSENGVMSSAQGTGGLGQSQAQVSLSSGELSSNAQSGGYNHGTNSQVQANEKGGLADAQANGPGSTSSQAQIGFTPYNENDTDDQETPFKGGGTASAQGGTYTGQSQSQITGKFRFGIKYTGSAQSQSGGSSSAPGNQTIFKPFAFPNITKQTQSTDRQNFSTNSNLNKNLRHASSTTTLRYEPSDITTTTEAVHEPEYYDENDYADYEDEDKHKIGTKSIIQTSGNQRQHIVLDPLEDLDATVHQAHGNDELRHGTILQPGQSVPGSSGYRIPQGFRGKVISFANGANTAAIGPNSQAQSVTLKPGSGKVIYAKPVYQLASRTHLYNGNYGYGSGYTYQPVTYKLKSGKSLPNFVAVTKSETGSQDLYTGKKTPSVYYSQSSTCGYFTNTCVFNGNTKVCTPKPKMNPDGSPVVC